MDFENLNQQIGGCGRYQYIAFCLLAVTTFKFSGDFQSLTFSLFEPAFACSSSNGSSLQNGSRPPYVSTDQCQYRWTANASWMACREWTYNKDMLDNSFITEFNLVCDRAFYKQLFFTSYFAGSLSTYPLVMLSDLVGRRHMMIAALFLSVGVSILQIAAYALWQHLLLWFVSGAVRAVYGSLTFTTLIELMPQAKRGLAATNFWLTFGVGYMLSALFALYGRSWRAISGMSLIFTFLYLCYFCYIPETPRWLMLKDRRDQSFSIMSFIARTNSRSLSRSEFDKWKPSQEKTGKVWELFQHRTMIFRLLILNFAAWSFNFAYLGSATDLTFASENIFITTFVMGLVELPTGPLAGGLANRLGRKKGVYILCVMGVVSLLVLPFIESNPLKSAWQPWFKMVMAMTAKLGFTSAWLIFDVITSETVPTTTRNSATMIVYVAVGLGSIIAPSVHSSALKWYHAAPCLIYSALLVMTIILVWRVIPETLGLPIPQTIEQAVSLQVNKEKTWHLRMRKESCALIRDSSFLDSSPNS